MWLPVPAPCDHPLCKKKRHLHTFQFHETKCLLHLTSLQGCVSVTLSSNVHLCSGQCRTCQDISWEVTTRPVSAMLLLCLEQVLVGGSYGVRRGKKGSRKHRHNVGSRRHEAHTATAPPSPRRSQHISPDAQKPVDINRYVYIYLTDTHTRSLERTAWTAKLSTEELQNIRVEMPIKPHSCSLSFQVPKIMWPHAVPPHTVQHAEWTGSRHKAAIQHFVSVVAVFSALKAQLAAADKVSKHLHRSEADSNWAHAKRGNPPRVTTAAGFNGRSLISNFTLPVWVFWVLKTTFLLQ